MSIEVKGLLLGLAAALGLLGVAFGLSPFLKSKPAADAQSDPSTNVIPNVAEASLEGQPKEGYRLFDHNCAACHGDDARGDEGPSLYDLKKTDARITRIIKEGIKGEMPRFGAKLNDADIQALIAYLRTLKS